MQTTRKSKLHKHAASRAVGLPTEFRLTGDEETENMILPTEPEAQAWKDFLASRRPEDVPDDWMKDRPLNRSSLEEEPPLFREDD